jgi:hypothetical protein
MKMEKARDSCQCNSARISGKIETALNAEQRVVVARGTKGKKQFSCADEKIMFA